MNIVSSNGVSDWLVQRCTAVIIAQYTLFVLLYVWFVPGLDFSGWSGLFHAVPMRVATLITVLAVLAHAWIGLWTVGTDYIKSSLVRLVYQTLILVMLAALLFWAVQIVWRL